jgi:membrane associated rhomboid family serine protease
VRAGHARRVARGLLPPLCFSAGAALAAALLAVVWGVPPSFRSMPVFLALAGLVYAAVAWRAAAAARRVTPEGFRGEFFAAIHAGWIAGRPAHLTRFLTVCIAAVGLLQLTARSRSLHVAGLLEPAVEAGEWWRVVTGGLVHGDELHFLVNFMALQQLGRLLEVHAHRALLPLVFLVSVVTGSAAELLLTDAFSVGASGGLLGVIGFLGVASVRRAGVLPHGFRTTIVTDLAAIAAVGLVGAAVIANAGHLGGLLGGAALGLLLVPSVAARPGIGWTPALPVRLLGWAAAAGVALAAAWTAALILGRV